MAQFSDNEVMRGLLCKKGEHRLSVAAKKRGQTFPGVGFSVGLVRLDPAATVDALRQRLSVMFR